MKVFRAMALDANCRRLQDRIGAADKDAIKCRTPA